jgi:soluble lytic murein transglycosylase-like protein
MQGGKDMSYAQITALIINIAASMNVPPYFALSIAVTENPTLNPTAVNKNENGTEDRGVFQTNDSWDKSDWTDIETNIRAGIGHIRKILSLSDVYTYWSAAVVYNAGYSRLNDPPEKTIEYANRVMLRWQEMDKVNFKVVIHGKK